MSVPKTKQGKPKSTISKAKKDKPSKSFVKKVQTVINKNLEDKQAWKKVTNTNYNSGIDSIGDVQFLVPNITQGTNDASRIGDQIRLKNFRVQGHIITNLTYNTYSACRIGVRVMIVQPKGYGSLTAIQTNAAAWLATLLKKGATTGVFAGLVEDLYTPINVDAITTYMDKVFYMQAPYIPGSNTGATNVYSMTKFFDFNFKVRNKLIRYDLAVDSGVTPVEYNPVILFGYVHLDVSAPDTITTQINASHVSTFTFQDS